MRVLISSSVFYPDHSGIALYASDFAFFCAEQGHEVDVVTSFPFYPQWQKRDEDKRKLFRKDEYNNINIYRGYIFVPEKITTLTRILSEISFIFSAFINFFKVKKPDIIVIFTTPVLLGFISIIFKQIYKSTLIINVQDFRIEAAESLSLIKDSIFIKILKKIELLSYKNADYVTSISPSMVDLLKTKGVQQPILWPNWIDTNSSIKFTSKGNFKEKYQLVGKHIIAYAGNVGEKQGLEFLIDISCHFQDYTNIIFLIIGEGAALERLKQYHIKKNNKNLFFLPFLNPEEYKHFLFDVDLFFLSQKKTSEDVYFPSKLLGIMTSCKPILLTADIDSELFKVFYEQKLGYVTPYGATEPTLDAIKTYLENKEATNLHISNAFEYVRFFDRATILNKILKLVK